MVVDVKTTAAEYAMAKKPRHRAQARKPHETVASRLLRIHDQEMSLIARELHDELNQRIAALALQLENMDRGLPDNSEVLHRELQAAIGGLRELSDEIHELARRLYPSMVELLGLAPALESLCACLSREGGMKVRFGLRRAPENIPAEIALCLYLVAQEILRYAAGHSGAREARMRLTGSDQAIGLAISDEGAGFDPARVGRTGGLGLVVIEERVRLVGGTLTIKSRPGHGTEIQVKVPLPDQE